MFDTMFYISKGFLILCVVTICFLAVIAALAWGSEYIRLPRLPNSLKWFLGIVFNTIMIVIGIMVVCAACYQIGGGPE